VTVICLVMRREYRSTAPCAARTARWSSSMPCRIFCRAQSIGPGARRAAASATRAASSSKSPVSRESVTWMGAGHLLPATSTRPAAASSMKSALMTPVHDLRPCPDHVQVPDYRQQQVHPHSHAADDTPGNAMRGEPSRSRLPVLAACSTGRARHIGASAEPDNLYLRHPTAAWRPTCTYPALGSGAWQRAHIRDARAVTWRDGPMPLYRGVLVIC
jgi:hypothetical protein